MIGNTMHNNDTRNISNHGISPDNMINGKTMGVSNSGRFINERVEVVVKHSISEHFSIFVQEV